MRIKLFEQEHRPTYPTTYSGSIEFIHYMKSREIYLSHKFEEKVFFFSSMKMGDVTVSVFHSHTNDVFLKSVVDIKSGIII